MHPISVIPAVILSFGGAFLALLISGKMLSMPSFIGLVMLIGVSTKNSILLVEYAIMAQREHGLSRFDALVDACHKRARPIIMTTIAMVAGMIPLVIGLGNADNSFRAPMAAAVIGGLITSTILSLLVTPSFFSIVDDIEHFVGVGKRKLMAVFGKAAPKQVAET
jgi:multidrug efflux pump subunit AcrB